MDDSRPWRNLEKRFDRYFFERYTPKVARELLGSILVRVVGSERLVGRIVEAEAYRGARDPASHAYRGETKRNAVMFGEGGHAYVYFTYGHHWCLNFTTERKGFAGAALIRALEPIEGVGRMKKNRGVEELTNLMSGPGKLTRAMEIDGRLNGEDLISSRRLYLLHANDELKVSSSTRVGLTTGVEKRWRYFVSGNNFVSKGRPSR